MFDEDKAQNLFLMNLNVARTCSLKDMNGVGNKF